MKTNKIKNILLACATGVLLSTGLSSCQDWLKEETYDFTQPDDIEDSDAGATQWLIGCYSRLSTLFNGNTFPMVWLYDEDYLTGPSWAFGTLGAGNFQNNGNINSMWTGLYELIHRCNYSTYMINQMVNVEPRLKTAILGELKFLKAWSYFQLVRAFGPIPVRKQSISETGDRNVPRSSVEDVYGYIIELLDEAKVECYKNTDKEYVAGRVTAGTAAGLEAKVYATMAAGAMPEGTQLWVRGGKPWSGEGTEKAYTDPQKLTYEKHQLDGYEAFDPMECYTQAYEIADKVMTGEYGTYELRPFEEIWKRANCYGPEQLWSIQGYSSDTRYCEYFAYHICGIEDSNGLISDGMWYGIGRAHV